MSSWNVKHTVGLFLARKSRLWQEKQLKCGTCLKRGHMINLSSLNFENVQDAETAAIKDYLNHNII